MSITEKLLAPPAGLGLFGSECIAGWNGDTWENAVEAWMAGCGDALRDSLHAQLIESGHAPATAENAAQAFVAQVQHEAAQRTLLREQMAMDQARAARDRLNRALRNLER